MKAHQLILTGSIILASLLLSACSTDTVGSSDVSPRAIHQDYSVTYDQASNTTLTTAEFRVGGWSGTTVQLQDPASIKVNGRELSRSTFLGTRYENRESGFIPTANFEYTEGDAKVLKNSISLASMSLLKADAMVVQGQDYAVEVSVPGGGSDTIQGQIVQTTTNGQYHTVYVDGDYQPASGRIVFSAVKLQQLSAGPATLQISRSHWSSLQNQTEEGGSINATYNLSPISVNIASPSVLAKP